ncbi:hypothetical protein CXB51_005092 [Gossypium anomalum]|uniref:Reverse transcriptase Ty1/copia-type domain-containing protein n=1 Tax=Gossypium anomalum TaxID=47600 RepID=A0A8J5ZMA0_9ROSI|nr:hypothetical protein CXB51_005092 [Gossypium anomalum]
MEKVRCMLSNANLPKLFWAEAASTACFLINRSPSVAIEKKTPQEVWFGNPANYSDLKIFGCPAYTHVDNEKLEPKSIKYVFLGYKAGVKGYKLWCPENRKVVISRDVVFYETAMLPNLSLKNSSNKENQKQVEHQINTESTPQTSTKIENRVLFFVAILYRQNRTRREIKPPKKYAEADLVTYALNVAEDIDANQEPSNYSEAISYEDSEKWMFAMQGKMKSLHENKTWDLVKLPKGVDFTDVFSPVVKHSSIRDLLGIVAMHDLELEQLDVKTAFLHGELEEDIYMQQPEGFTVSEKEDYVYLLKKSLYGLKQSPKQWYKRFDSFMTSHDFKNLSYSVLYAVSAVSRYMANPGKEHWKAVQWILRYYEFGRTEDESLGMLMLILLETLMEEDLSQVMSLQSKVVQSIGKPFATTVTLSTNEAEYMAITEACKEAIWLKGLFSELMKTSNQHIKPLRGFMEEVENLFVESFAIKNLFIENSCQGGEC